MHREGSYLTLQFSTARETQLKKDFYAENATEQGQPRSRHSAWHGS